MHSLRLLLLLVCALASAVHAGTLRGRVSYVTDGDTLWLRPAGGGAPIAVRLVGIDAPEGCQPFGPQARKALAEHVLQQSVVVRTRGVDDYDRVLGVVQLQGQDINAWLVREGHAWAAGYGRRRGPYALLEQEARAARRGLWSVPGALEPRTFRRQHGRCQ